MSLVVCTQITAKRLSLLVTRKPRPDLLLNGLGKAQNMRKVTASQACIVQIGTAIWNQTHVFFFLIPEFVIIFRVRVPNITQNSCLFYPLLLFNLLFFFFANNREHCCSQEAFLTSLKFLTDSINQVFRQCLIRCFVLYVVLSACLSSLSYMYMPSVSMKHRNALIRCS